MTDLDKELENALQVCNNLSRDARAAGDLPTMYAANRAWHQLSDALKDRRSYAWPDVADRTARNPMAVPLEAMTWPNAPEETMGELESIIGDVENQVAKRQQGCLSMRSERLLVNEVKVLRAKAEYWRLIAERANGERV